MSEVDLPERLARYGGTVQLKRIALVKRDLTPPCHPSRPARSGRTRATSGSSRSYGRRCWELDAMNPNDLRDRVRKEIERHIDPTLWNRAIEIEAAEVASMKDFHEAWNRSLKAAP